MSLGDDTWEAVGNGGSRRCLCRRPETTASTGVMNNGEEEAESRRQSETEDSVVSGGMMWLVLRRTVCGSCTDNRSKERQLMEYRADEQTRWTTRRKEDKATRATLLIYDAVLRQNDRGANGYCHS